MLILYSLLKHSQNSTGDNSMCLQALIRADVDALHLYYIVSAAWLSLSTAIALSAYMYITVSLSKIVSSNGNCPRAWSELARQVPSYVTISCWGVVSH